MFLSLAKIQERTGVKASLNREGGYVSLSGSVDQVVAAKALLDAMKEVHAERNMEVRVESWMTSFIVGSKGANIVKLEADTGAKLNVDRDRGVVQISADSREVVTAAQATVQELVDRLAAQRVVIPMSSMAIGLVIGRGGTTIRGLQDESGASIDVDRDSNMCVIRGSDPDAVAKCKEMVEQLLADNDVSAGRPDGAGAGGKGPERTFKIDRNDARAIIGTKGAGIRGLEESTGTSINIDRDSNVVTVRGDSQDAVDDAVVAIKKVTAANKSERRSRDRDSGKDKGAGGAGGAGESRAPMRAAGALPIGMGPASGGGASGAAGSSAKSKVARRRERKKADRFKDPTIDAGGDSNPKWGATSGDILSNLLSSSSASTSSASAVTASGRRVAPPPGLAPPPSTNGVGAASGAAPGASAAAAPPAPPVSAFALLGLSSSGTAPASAAAAAPAPVSKPGEDYFVSSSGFSVRL